MTLRFVLVWLEWPEKCFCVDAEALRYLQSLLPKGAKIVRARSEAGFLKSLPQATHVLTWHFKAEWYALAKNARLVATPAAGRELVSEEAPKGVKVHFGGFHGPLIAESVLGFLLAWAHGFFAVRQAPVGWPRTWLSDKCYTLAGTRAVIVGYGRIGRAIGARLAALGVEVFGLTRHGVFGPDGRRLSDNLSISQSLGRTIEQSNNRTFEHSNIRTFLSSCDWLILALPSTTGTDDFLDAKLIAKLPRRCVVVNVGRGNAVDEAALVKALGAGRLAGAYLDVCKTEPTAVKRRVKGLAIDPLDPQVPNLVLMPHSCAFAPQYLKMFFKELKDEGLV